MIVQINSTAPSYMQDHSASPSPIEWQVSANPVAYPDAIAQMQRWSDGVSAGHMPEQVWLLEHPSLYTAGTSAKCDHLLVPNRFPVFKTGRGGEYTYHGPGQRIVYLALDIRQRFGSDVRAYVHSLEDWIIAALGTLGVSGQRGGDQIGVWIQNPISPDAPPRKIAAIGVRVRRGIALHGVALNVAPNLEHFSGIIACGGDGDKPTSLANLDVSVTTDTVDQALKNTFAKTMLSLRQWP